MDDVLIINNDIERIKETKKFLSSTFKVKDFEQVHIILRIKDKNDSGGYSSSQLHCVENVINKYKHLNIQEINTPLDPSIKLIKNDERAVAQIEYASAIKSLIYTIQFTTSNVALIVSKLSMFTSNPNLKHWKAIGRFLGYLKKIRNLGQQYTKFPTILEVYTDASSRNK